MPCRLYEIFCQNKNCLRPNSRRKKTTGNEERKRHPMPEPAANENLNRATAHPLAGPSRANDRLSGLPRPSHKNPYTTNQ
ncbi:hypothetical protein AW736_01550 [Termitidicoccus mucosus]|uniref:Uncharacterized protein n=1 Tax=Termitidicoccus mucosus TaxID=1184151 RepID=A0A178IPN4_9BACT|nr:hypothetical protein AW736_01550 [Opitutaceae bacterium TSB47]